MPDPNPLVQDHHLPPFSAIRAEHLAPAIDVIVSRSRAEVERIVASQQHNPNWDDLVLAMENVTSRIGWVLGIIHILDSVNVDARWNEASVRASHRVFGLIDELESHQPLYKCYQALANSPPAALFDAARRSMLGRALHKFRRAGIELEPAAHARFVALNHEISGLRHLFLTQLAEANEAWSKHISDETQLNGLSTEFKLRMARNARAENLQGWLIRLSDENYRECMAHAQDRALREQVFIAYNTRASDLGPQAGQFDNGLVLQLLLANRNEQARLLGYPNFVELALEPQILDRAEQVLAFIRQQIALEQDAFAHDRRQLEVFAREVGLTVIQPWDYAFLAQSIRQQASGVTEETLREYFALDTTLVRLFEWVEQLFGARIIELADFDTWTPGVRLLQVQADGEVLGHIYFVPYLPQANGGFAHVFSLKNRWTTAEGRRELPVVVLNSRFEVKPHEPCLLSPRQLKVLFHEFGHCLHQVLMGIGYRTRMGLDELGIDSAEFCGQFFERWCDSTDCLIRLSSHYLTGAPMPDALAQRQWIYANTQTSWDRAESLTLALFDTEVHRTHGDGRSVQQVFSSANREVGHLPMLDDVRYADGFNHLVSGYEGVFYSYRWSAVLANAAFKRFEREGVFNQATGRAFREQVLAPGNSRSLLESLQMFSGESAIASSTA